MILSIKKKKIIKIKIMNSFYLYKSENQILKYALGQ